MVARDTGPFGEEADDFGVSFAVFRDGSDAEFPGSIGHLAAELGARSTWSDPEVERYFAEVEQFFEEFARRHFRNLGEGRN